MLKPAWDSCLSTSMVPSLSVSLRALFSSSRSLICCWLWVLWAMREASSPVRSSWRCVTSWQGCRKTNTISHFHLCSQFCGSEVTHTLCLPSISSTFSHFSFMPSVSWEITSLMASLSRSHSPLSFLWFSFSSSISFSVMSSARWTSSCFLRHWSSRLCPTVG